MARELFSRETMQAAQQTDYLGAFLEDERRLMLVRVDPDDPWAAFRKMRRALRRTGKAETASVGLIEAPEPIDHRADVISLQSRRRAG